MCQDRRGLAYDQVAILSQGVHARWVALMIKHKHRVPPPRYERVTWNQLYDADCELFTLAAQSAKGGIRPDPSGIKPLDAIFEHLMLDNRVTFFLMPLPLSNYRGDTPSDAADRPAKRQKSDNSHLAFQNWPSSGSDARQGKQKGKGQGQGRSGGKGKSGHKGKSNRTLPSGPFGVAGGQLTATKNGKAICPDFNSSMGCSEGMKSKGVAFCPKGLHLCSHSRCVRRAAHGFTQHTHADE